MRALNLAHLSWQQCYETQDSLLVLLDSCKVAFKLYDTTIANLQTDKQLLQQSITDRDIVMKDQGTIIAAQKKEIKKLKATNTILTITTVVFGVATLVLLIL